MPDQKIFKGSLEEQHPPNSPKNTLKMSRSRHDMHHEKLFKFCNLVIPRISISTHSWKKYWEQSSWNRGTYWGSYVPLFLVNHSQYFLKNWSDIVDMIRQYKLRITHNKIKWNRHISCYLRLMTQKSDTVRGTKLWDYPV